MIKVETIAPNILKITPPQTLKTENFNTVAPQVEDIIRQQGKIRLLVDATHFGGWDGMKTFETHMSFVKTHQRSIERVAVIAGHMWQHWLVGIMKIFVHPDIRVFDKKEEQEAGKWIAGESMHGFFNEH